MTNPTFIHHPTPCPPIPTTPAITPPLGDPIFIGLDHYFIGEKGEKIPGNISLELAANLFTLPNKTPVSSSEFVTIPNGSLLLFPGSLGALAALLFASGKDIPTWVGKLSNQHHSERPRPVPSLGSPFKDFASYPPGDPRGIMQGAIMAYATIHKSDYAKAFDQVLDSIIEVQETQAELQKQEWEYCPSLINSQLLRMSDEVFSPPL